MAADPTGRLCGAQRICAPLKETCLLPLSRVHKEQRFLCARLGRAADAKGRSDSSRDFCVTPETDERHCPARFMLLAVSEPSAIASASRVQGVHQWKRKIKLI